MQRSASTSLVAADFFKSGGAGGGGLEETDQLLPTFDPQSHVAKKERSRIRTSENAIHLIPLVLVVCAFVLWLFSHSELKD